MRARQLPLVLLLASAACGCGTPPPRSLDRAVEAYPKDAGVRVRRARLFRDGGSLERAAEDYRAAIAIAPRSDRIAAELALMLLGGGRTADALAALDGSRAPADAWLAVGKGLWDAGDAASAAAVWEAGARAHPEDKALARDHAYALYGRGDFAGAAAEYRRALAIDPLDADVEADLGWALLKLGRKDEARAIAERVLARAPGAAGATGLRQAASP